MNSILVPMHKNTVLRDERMLFVRSEGILQTMIKAPLIFVGLLAVAIVIPIQSSFSSSRSLDLIIFPDGSTHVTSKYEINPLNTEVTIKLLGTNIDNFIAIDEEGFLLTSNMTNGIATIETFGSNSIQLDYDTHDLVSKSGRIWTFNVNTESPYSLLMPKNSIIVGMSDIPIDMEIVDGQSKLTLSSGSIQIDYVFGTTLTTPVTSNNSDYDFTFIIIGITATILGIIGIVYFKKSKSAQPSIKQSIKSNPQTDPQLIFNANPDLREDDKEIIKFIHQNGGQALESELRKKFLQPRTTMWRAVKRLERHGIVEIEKKDLQNLVKLKFKEDTK